LLRNKLWIVMTVIQVVMEETPKLPTSTSTVPEGWSLKKTILTLLLMEIAISKKQTFFATISNYKYATTTWDETTLKTNLATWAPLSICVDARYWQDYKSGIMTAFECDWIVELDHCVQAVGYDVSGSNPFWSVRNSWGTSWGEEGYIRLEYGYNSCGLTEQATSAVL